MDWKLVFVFSLILFGYASSQKKKTVTTTVVRQYGGAGADDESGGTRQDVTEEEIGEDQENQETAVDTSGGKNQGRRKGTKTVTTTRVKSGGATGESEEGNTTKTVTTKQVKSGGEGGSPEMGETKKTVTTKRVKTSGDVGDPENAESTKTVTTKRVSYDGESDPDGGNTRTVTRQRGRARDDEKFEDLETTGIVNGKRVKCICQTEDEDTGDDTVTKKRTFYSGRGEEYTGGKTRKITRRKYSNGADDGQDFGSGKRTVTRKEVNRRGGHSNNPADGGSIISEETLIYEEDYGDGPGEIPTYTREGRPPRYGQHGSGPVTTHGGYPTGNGGARTGRGRSTGESVGTLSAEQNSTSAGGTNSATGKPANVRTTTGASPGSASGSGRSSGASGGTAGTSGSSAGVNGSFVGASGSSAGTSGGGAAAAASGGLGSGSGNPASSGGGSSGNGWSASSASSGSGASASGRSASESEWSTTMATTSSWTVTMAEWKSLQVTLAEMRTEITKLRLDFERIEGRVVHIEANPFPVGFTYTQIANTAEPAKLWPHVAWKDVTSSYAGIFFRAHGGDSAGFGVTQAGSSPRLARVNTQQGTCFNFDESMSIPASGTSPWIRSGDDVRGGCDRRVNINFEMSAGEVRPVNQAIRIWQVVAR